MSSYYNRIEGTLNPGQTARSSDIHLIQSGIQDAFQRALIDICGTGVVLGESENALKLTPTTYRIDQTNSFDYADPEDPGISFYEIYLRQPIDIEKSSIDKVRLQMTNTSNIEVTLHAEIRDADFDLVDETNTTLPPTDNDEYIDIDFIFSQDHLPLGRYYFILRPVDISTIDLTQNGDEVFYDTITEDMFKVKYDKEGHYSNIEDSYDGIVSDNDILYSDNIGLYASYDGNEYMQAKLLETYRYIDEPNNEIFNKNFDLCFECFFSSGNTYLINNGAAIVLGEKVYPLDTHVTIDGPDTNGDRTDLVILTTDGQLNVIKGTVYNGEKQYPIDNTGLKIAYITTYKYGMSEEEKESILTGSQTLSDVQINAYNQKVPSIEQDDENNITRQRDILERIRRLEKKMTYNNTHNTPSRIKYVCNIDPILNNNGVNDKDTEGTYGMGVGKNENGETVFTTGKSETFSWSIIENNYSYQYTDTSKVNGELKVFDIHMPLSKPKSIKSFMQCEIRLRAPGYGTVTESNQLGYGGVPYAKMQITIKKNSKTIETINAKTNNDGVCLLSLWNIKKLKAGNYKVYVKYNERTVKANLTVYKDGDSLKNITRKVHMAIVVVRTATAAQATQKLPDGVIPANDSFYLDKVTLDEEKGTVTVQRIDDDSDYQKNKLLKDRKVFSSVDNVYKLKSDKVALTSEYPVLNFTLESDTRIKTFTPYIAGFKNVDKFGILVFKNDFVFDKITNTRKVIQKKISKKDDIFPTIYNSGWKSLSDLAQGKDGYKKPKKQVSFNVNKTFEAGTYSLVVYGHIKKGKEGAIKIKEYVTRDYRKEYGIATKCTGGSKLSVINMDTSNLSNKSWDLLIEQKPYKYYDTGMLISKTIESSDKIVSCKVKSNFKVPNGCKINIYVSNNGGASWVSVNNKQAHFKGDGYAFKWKLEMISSATQTPVLLYNDVWKYAISFRLNEEKEFIEFEDYKRCYETPLINANYITRRYTANEQIEHRFSEWEFARLYMEDEDFQSKIDILISYADNAYTSPETAKKDWDKSIFFSQIFADLTLEDFSRESVDYDNYEGNVEYDEYNYPFKFEADYTVHETGDKALASPDVYYNNPLNTPYMYGDITRLDSDGFPINNLYNEFAYEYDGKPYEYADNSEDETMKYAGMRVVDGPCYTATQKESNTDITYTNKDVIIGVRFKDVLEIDETSTSLRIGIKPVLKNQITTINEETNQTTTIDKAVEYGIDSEERQEGGSQELINTFINNDKKIIIPPDTFEVVVSTNQYAEIDEEDATNGKAYSIDVELINEEYNIVNIDIVDDLDGFSDSGVGSIGIRIKNDDTKLQNGDKIGIGRISTNPFNRRAYVPYMYTGKWDRLSWQTLNDKCQAFAMYRPNKPEGLHRRIFYPITNYDKNYRRAEIKFVTNKLESTNKGKVVAKYSSKGKEITRTIEKKASLIMTPSGQLEGVPMWLMSGTSYKKETGEETSHCSDYHSSTIIRNGNVIRTRFYEKKNNETTLVAYETNNTGNATLFYMPANVKGKLFQIDMDIPYTIYDLINIQYYVFSTYNNNNVYTNHGQFSKGDIVIHLYDTTDTNNAEPVESFALPAWGYIQANSTAQKKNVSTWFKKRSNATTIKSMIIERLNPREKESTEDLYLMLSNMLFFNAEHEPALGPQMQMRIYPNTSGDVGSNTTIRKVGGIYRL